MFLNNLLLAFITQEFSLAVIRFTRKLKQSIIIVQGVHFVFALFNLQGTAARRSKLSYISTDAVVCQELFSTFLKILF